MRQRELGVAQIAGTSDMPIEGQPSMPSSGFNPGNLCTCQWCCPPFQISHNQSLSFLTSHPVVTCTGGRGGGGRGSRGGGRAGGRAGRSPGRGFGRGPAGGAGSSGPGRPQPGTKRGMEFGEGQQADKRQKSANGEAVVDGQIGGLASLMQYGSDDDGDASTRPNGIAGTSRELLILAGDIDEKRACHAVCIHVMQPQHAKLPTVLLFLVRS